MKVIGTAGIYLLISLSYLCSNILGPGERDAHAHAQNVCFCLISISLFGCVHNCKMDLEKLEQVYTDHVYTVTSIICEK